MNPQSDIQALRKALDAYPTEGPFTVVNDCVYRDTDEELGTPIIHVCTSQFVAHKDLGMIAADALWFATATPDRIRRVLAALLEAK
jgi:hypothetical protein